jgi:hypothetical protein
MATKPVLISRKADPAAAMSEEEWQMRVDLAACYRLIAHYDMDDMFATHISARVPGDADHFLLNPYGVLFEQIRRRASSRSISTAISFKTPSTPSTRPAS